MRAKALPVLAILLLSPAGAWSQDAPPPSLKLPAEVRGSPGVEILVKAETTAKKVAWRALDPGLMLVSRSRLLDQKEMPVFACQPGRYRLAAWCCAGDGDVTEQQETVVVVEGAPPPPPGPTPLTVALQAAYNADPDPKKAELLKDLRAVWKLAPGLCDRRNDGSDPATVEALLLIIKKAADGMSRDALKGVRVKIAEELKVALPDPKAPLTDLTLAAAKALFVRVSQSLEGVKEGNS